MIVCHAADGTCDCSLLMETARSAAAGAAVILCAPMLTMPNPRNTSPHPDSKCIAGFLHPHLTNHDVQIDRMRTGSGTARKRPIQSSLASSDASMSSHIDPLLKLQVAGANGGGRWLPGASHVHRGVYTTTMELSPEDARVLCRPDADDKQGQDGWASANQPDREHCKTEHVDMVVVGAGLSGIGAAVSLRRDFPDCTLVVLEAAEGLGGTWRTFQYPGVRSDSDMYVSTRRNVNRFVASAPHRSFHCGPYGAKVTSGRGNCPWCSVQGRCISLEWHQISSHCRAQVDVRVLFSTLVETGHAAC